MSTRSIKGIWLLLVESLDFERVIQDDEQHGSGEPSRVEEADTRDPASQSIDIMTSPLIDSSTSTSIDTISYFLELEDEAQPENLDHNLENKLDDHQHTSIFLVLGPGIPTGVRIHVSFNRYSRDLAYTFICINEVSRGSVCWFRDDLEESGDFGVFWSLFSAELHRRVRCLAMDGDILIVRLSSSFNISYIFELPFQCHRFEVNQHPIADIMHVLLNSGQSASREEAVEEMKDCRSTVHP
ncbi:hypothetical protein IGI04_040536 [Brassica rapa subsp. trilocularis]|uniref:TF-B3 domain-containing protein n=1 Tax=Brassica rapa subsp. trilocularis TaxID=1813537 RepID=A0ABQ7KR23_BRACM|nr:hypothetical protein IGI04_040536 [Brassica rapa subsp. trilocularis]